MSLSDKVPPPQDSVEKPVLIIVAPNGARLTKRDHPQLPETSQQLADCALACQQAGAAMLHMHARDQFGKHTLDAALNQRYLDAVRGKVGEAMMVQLTTESIGQYSPKEQMALVRQCRPEAASIALREIIPDETSKAAARDFFMEVDEYNIVCQLIIYSAEDLRRYYQLQEEQVLSADRHHLLFVIGRHGNASEKALAELLSQFNFEVDWAVCAFGRLEHRLTSAAMALNGDIRVGFENNVFNLAGQPVVSNAELVEQSVAVARVLNRPLMTAAQFRAKMVGLTRK